MMLGLGSILGSGVFVSIGLGAGIAGPAVLLAIVLAALVATCNGLNSAQLAASHPVSGGTYEYGYQYLNPTLGFTAGWLFLCAKSASAATAALGFSGYLLNALRVESTHTMLPLALLTVVLLTILVLTGLRRSNQLNVVIVTLVLISLLLFVLAGLPLAHHNGLRHFVPFFSPLAGQGSTGPAFFHATALMFVAYTGYGRIATLGEEVRDPKRTIPRAVIMTLIVSMVVYMVVAVLGIGTVGAQNLYNAANENAAPLVDAALRFGYKQVAWIVTAGAITAMLGVLLNLILGLSRILLAMGRRGDMPSAMGRLNTAGTTPFAAVVTVGVLIGLLTLTGNVRTTWTFSAFTVLIYYALTNLAALRLPPSARLYPKWLAWLGLGACLFLSCWVETGFWILGLGMILIGLAWQRTMRRIKAKR